jgi:hypothetical protein
MKSKLILLAFLLSKFCIAQINRTEVVNNTTSVPCNPNTFWLNHEDANTPGIYNIREYSLINNVISPTGYVIFNVPNQSIGYCNDLTLGSGMTFYDVDSYLTNDFLRYDGSNWIHEPIPNNTYEYFNIAGNKNTLVAHARLLSNYPKYIARYDGSSINIIYDSGLAKSITSGDLVVDSLENIWFFESSDTNFLKPTNLKVINNLGQLVNDYNVDYINSIGYGGYGMFIMNNTLYFGVDYLNPINPNTLIPLNIVADSVIQGVPISFVAPAARWDLESCNQGTLTSVKDVPASYKQLSVYPNPATDQFSVYIPYGTNVNAHIIVTNLQGAILEDRLVKDNKIPINCLHWPAGMYLVSVVSNDRGIVTAKVLKQ